MYLHTLTADVGAHVHVLTIYLPQFSKLTARMIATRWTSAICISTLINLLTFGKLVRPN